MEPSVPTGKASSDKKQELTPERIRELKQNEEIIQILYIAEQYLGKTLSPTESQKLLFFYDGLGLSADLIEYLLEYCVSHNHKSIRYIEKVAIAWAEEGITTVEQASSSNSRYNKEYFTILKALGITNRNPVETEITLMDTWLKTYCFSMEIIQEACNRTVLQTGQASFSIRTRSSRAGRRKKSKLWTTSVLWMMSTRNAARARRLPPGNRPHLLPITVLTISNRENMISANMRSIC